MPELPEVETVRRVLQPQLAGRVIVGVSVLHAGVVARPSPSAFAAALAGQAISALGRRGKYLQLHFRSGAALVLHLRMTGRLLVAPPHLPKERHTHIVFSLDDKNELRFCDARRFGRLWFIGPGEADTFTGMEKLGPEPFDAALTAGYLQGAAGRRRAPIKACLLDQTLVAGIGNIYADEILFSANIHPARPAAALTVAQWRALAAAIPAVLAEMIEKNSISAADYLAARGGEYRNTPYLRVYGHGGRACPACGARLERAVIAGRGSCFCPRCQPVPRAPKKKA